MSNTPGFEDRVRTRAYFISQKKPLQSPDHNYLEALNEENHQCEIQRSRPVCVVCAGTDHNCDWQQLMCEHFMHNDCRINSQAYCPECLNNLKVRDLQEVTEDEREYFQNENDDNQLGNSLEDIPMPESPIPAANHLQIAEAEFSSSSSSQEELSDHEIERRLEEEVIQKMNNLSPSISPDPYQSSSSEGF